MHAFWLILLCPLFLIAAYFTNKLIANKAMTNKMIDQSKRAVAYRSASRIWKFFALLTTLALVAYLAIDGVYWASDLSEQSNEVSDDSSRMGIDVLLKRAVFCGLTATDLPILQIWLATMIAYGFTIQNARPGAKLD